MCNCPSCSWDGPYMLYKEEWVEDRINRLHKLSDCKLADLLNVPYDELQDYTFPERDWAIRDFLEDYWDLNFGEPDDYVSELEEQEVY